MMQVKINKMMRFIAGVACLVSAYAALTLPNISEAATLYMRPSASSVSVGDIVSVRFLVNTEGKYINTTDAAVNFPTDMFDVVSVSKSNSIFTLWVEGPRFSNPEGKIVFDGGIPTPGYIGSGGEVAAVTLRAKKAGTATLIFSSASVRENDGMGTDILTSKPSATIQITAPKIAADDKKPEEANKLPVVTKVAVPAKPSILSSTHPEQGRWYKETTAIFRWNVPSDVVSVQASLNVEALDNPSVAYDGSVSSKTLSNLEDGVYYFNLRYRNSIGKSPTGHHMIRIDSTAPELAMPVVEEASGRNAVAIDASDSMSGIAYYELQIDSQPALRISQADIVEGRYVLGPQIKGMHTLVVRVFDKAGNSKQEKISFNSPGIIPPEISIFNESIEIGDDIAVHGSSIYPNAKVGLTIRFESGKTRTVEGQTELDGSFDIVFQDIDIRGTSKIIGTMMFANDVLSGPSNELTLRIGGPKAVQTFAAFAYPVFSMVLIVFLILILIFLIYLGWFKFFKLRNRLKSDLQIMTEGTHKTLITIKRELARQLNALKKIKQDRKLNDAEQEIFDDIRKRIDGVDDFIQDVMKHLL